MKVGIVYTSTTPELVQMVNDQFEKAFSGEDVEFASYQNPGILQQVRENGGVTPHSARDLVDLYEQAVREGADILLNACSSVGDIAAAAQPLYKMTGVPLVRIDEDMARAAIKEGKRIGVVATLQSTLEPTKRLVEACAKEAGIAVTLVDALAENAFGLDQEQFKNKLIETAQKVKGDVDLLLFAQGSMAYAEEPVSQAVGLPVFSSIRFGVRAVRDIADQLIPNTN